MLCDRGIRECRSKYRASKNGDAVQSVVYNKLYEFSTSATYESTINLDGLIELNLGEEVQLGGGATLRYISIIYILIM